mmetsp:Transcript_33732/g.32770  ORF Transcript_33732/g.32770 Transcript_33732/m.32770 type:complete len:81 (+) Transcript_33732:256-498(+)
MKYGVLVNHLEKECIEVIVNCPLQCGEHFQKKLLETHLKTCKELKCQCTRCDYQVPQCEIDEHDCIRTLKKEIEKLKASI